MLPQVTIYTDGSCDREANGGWAASLYWNGRTLHMCGGTRNTTNNRMELYAVIRAIRELVQKCFIVVYSDSQYVVQGINHNLDKWIDRNWITNRGTKVVNKDLWLEMMELLQKHYVTAEWVKGHNNNPCNEIVDGLAGSARPERQRKFKIKQKKGFKYKKKRYYWVDD